MLIVTLWAVIDHLACPRLLLDSPEASRPRRHRLGPLFLESPRLVPQRLDQARQCSRSSSRPRRTELMKTFMPEVWHASTGWAIRTRRLAGEVVPASPRGED